MGTRWMSRSATAMVAAVRMRVLRLRSRRPSHATVVAYGALFVALGGTALATTQGFVLGATNRVNAASKVTNVKADNTQSAIASPLLTFENLTTGTGASALALNVASGHAPFTTNSATRVTNLNADRLDGLDSSAFARFKRIVLVRAGGSATANGTALRSALAGIGDASSSNPYLVKIEPGVYDLGSTALVMKPHVDVEGSGIGTTTLTGAIANGTDGVVDGAASSELRFLTVKNTGVTSSTSTAIAIFDAGGFFRLTQVAADASGTPRATAIRFTGAGAVTLDGVHASASGTTDPGVVAGIIISSSVQMNLDNVVATAQNGSDNAGIDVNGTSAVTMSDVTAAGQGLIGSTHGLFVGGGGPSALSTVLVRNSVLSGTTDSVESGSGGQTVSLGASQLSGTVLVGGGDTVKCAQVYKADFTETAANTCP